MTDENFDEQFTAHVSRRIAAPAADIFALLADPRRQVELDGSGMLLGAGSEGPITAVGDVFVMRMHADHLGDYEMDNHVVYFEPDRRIGWSPANGRGHPRAGQSWGQRWSYELRPDGPGHTAVTESYDCSRAPADEREEVANGEAWVGAMTATLERLAALVERRST